MTRRAIRRSFRLSLGLRAGAAVTLAALALAAVSAGSPKGPDVRMMGGATGALSISNSNEGRAILAVGGMRPRDAAKGAVTVWNSGTSPGSFVLSQSNLVDAVGIGGGVLSGKLDLSVVDVTDPASPTAVYAGKLGEMGAVALGTFYPGDARKYEFRVAFPDGGAPRSRTSGDNAYQAASMSVQYDWTATASGSDTSAPETTIVDGPTNPSGSTSAEFEFTASEPRSTFECALDGDVFTACTSPKRQFLLAAGTHTFRVRATDAAGNTDATPATYTWTVDTTPVFSPLTLAVTGPRKLEWANRSPIELRVQLSRRASVTTSLYNPFGKKICAEKSQLSAGPSSLKLECRPFIEAAGLYKVRVVARTADSQKSDALTVRILAPAGDSRASDERGPPHDAAGENQAAGRTRVAPGTTSLVPGADRRYIPFTGRPGSEELDGASEADGRGDADDARAGGEEDSGPRGEGAIAPAAALSGAEREIGLFVIALAAAAALAGLLRALLPALRERRRSAQAE